MRKGREARAILGKKKERKKEGKRLKGRRKKYPNYKTTIKVGGVPPRRRPVFTPGRPIGAASVLKKTGKKWGTTRRHVKKTQWVKKTVRRGGERQKTLWDKKTVWGG